MKLCLCLVLFLLVDVSVSLGQVNSADIVKQINEIKREAEAAKRETDQVKRRASALEAVSSGGTTSESSRTGTVKSGQKLNETIAEELRELEDKEVDALMEEEGIF